MRVVDDAVEDGVGDGRLVDDSMPFGDRDLGGDQGRSALIALLGEFEEVVALLGGEAVCAPVVEDQELNLGKLVDQSRVSAVLAGQGEVLEQSGYPAVEHRLVEPGGLVSQRTGDPGFSQPSRTSNILPDITWMRRRFTTAFTRKPAQECRSLGDDCFAAKGS